MEKVILALANQETDDNNRFMQSLKPQLDALMQDKVKMVSEFMVMFLAGTDTTSHVIHNLMLQLAWYPEVKKKLEQELKTFIKEDNDFTYDQINNLKYLDNVVKETLRVNTPAPGIMPRQPIGKENVQIGDLIIQNGTQVQLIFNTTLENEDNFQEPKVFNPDRWNSENANLSDPFVFTPFSMGEKSCIGERLSLLEIKTITAYFISHFDFSVDVQYDDITWVPKVVIEPREKVSFQLWKRDLRKEE